jgi:iron(III) transport system permease protein
MTQAPPAPSLAPDAPVKPRLLRGLDLGGSLRHYLLLALLIGVLGLLMVYPVLKMIVTAFTPVAVSAGGVTHNDYLYWFKSALAGLHSPPWWAYAIFVIVAAARIAFAARAATRSRWTASKILGLLGLLAVIGILMLGFFARCEPGSLVSKIRNSLLLATVVTLLCNLIAFPLAIISHRYSFTGKALLSSIVLVPMVLPPFVGAIGMRQILSKFGSVSILCQHLGLLGPHEGVNWLQTGGFWALAVLVTLGLYPIAYLNLQAALANIDPAMLEAAQNLGGRKFRNFFKITLPLAMPGIFAGSTIIFIWAFNELGTALLIDYKDVVSRAVWDDLSVAQSGTSALPYAKTTIVLLISIIVYMVGKLTFGRQANAMTSKAAVAATQESLGLRGTLLAALPFLVVTFLAMLPHLGVILYSFTPTATESGVGWGDPGHFGWYRTVIPSRYTLAGYSAVFNNPFIYGSILNSLQYAAISSVVDVILGIAIAWLLIRTRVWGRGGLDVLSMLPLAIPGLVMAYGYLSCRGQVADVVNGLVQLVYTVFHWGKFAGMSIDWFKFHPFMILVIAYSMRRLPYLVRSGAAGLQQTSVSLEEAAANLGASPLKVIWKITIPLIAANLIAGALLTFSFAMLEVSDSLILAPLPESFPISKMIYQLGTDTAGADTVRNACALGVLAMGLLAATIITAGTLMGKKLGAIFRA